ncbi:DUF5819 family protein [Actinacidiphila bryophytorum]|uniref:Uncharacterized protein n=1 Tax=Actinacidiphila bryophytorum TaxID=1436133 RepID=A0A9W4MJL3_9ACTN|nr:DUF5819 family protein [Actinacidiphila bryophytorum]MBM9437369.1 hypothetical protein [Actinacidiphila bryophytorum]MBN6542847.1 hypothetical protein [Actinacidiphila bryophytorum]CAG7651817.1 conserved hypothetical protein [Actinacidiphila bryophytorum]
MQSEQGPSPQAATLSLPARIAVAVTVGVVAVGALLHLGMVFLHVAPSNTLSKEHASAVSDYVYPEFEQNWKLFAPDPLQQNVHVQARAEVRKPDGSTETTGWVDLTAMDVADMRHNPLPSHSQQNELRRAWGYYSDNHSDQNQTTPISANDLSGTYLNTILAKRLGTRLNGGTVVRVQGRAATTTVARPSWSGESVDTTTQYRELPWWTVPTAPAGQENAS